MTYTKKQVLPALHKSNKIKNPDMPDIEDRNYTSTILKYGNLALPFPQLDTNAKTVVAAINELYASPGGTEVIANPSEDATDLLYSLKVDSTTYSVQGFEITGTLIAGQTTLIFNNAKITTSSTFNVFTDPYGAILNDIIATNGKLILSFEEQQSNVAVKVRIT